jgi:AsmA family protein
MRWKLVIGIIAAVATALLAIAAIVLYSYDYNRLKPAIDRVVENSLRRRLTLSGDIRIKLGFPPVLEARDGALQNAAWGSRPDMLSVKRLEARLDLMPLLHGIVRVKRLDLVDVALLIETASSGASNWGFADADIPGAPPAPPPAAEPGPDIFACEELSVENGTVVIIDHRSGSEQTARIDRLAFKAESFHSLANVQFQGLIEALPVQISGRIGSIAGVIRPAAPWPVELTARAAGMDIRLSGSLRKPADLAGVDLSVAAKGADLTNLQQITGAAFPLSGPFTISGRLTDPEAGSWKVSDMAATLGESRITGILSVKAGADRPFVDASLTSERLDLRPLLRREGHAVAGGAAAPHPQRGRKVFSADPFDFGWLRRADVSARVDVDHLLLPTLAVDGVHGTARLQAGRLRLQPLTAGVGGGKLELDLSLDARAPTAALAASVKVEGLDVHTMLKALSNPEPITGLLNLDITAHTAGASPAAWMADMNGDVIAMAKKGHFPSQHWQFLGEDLRTLLKRQLDPLAQPSTVTAVECLVLDFNVVNGIARSDVMLLVTDHMLATGVGEVNLKDEELRFAFKPVPREKDGSTLTAGFGFSLSGLSEAFVLTGPLSDPTLSISTTDAAKTLAKAVGGALLLGPVGLAAVFLEHSSGDADPCRTAIEATGKGPYKAPAPSSSPGPKKQTDTLLKRFGSSIDNFFKK